MALMYFVIGDYLAAGVIGLLSVLAAWPVPDGWPMFPAMMLAMLLGMVAYGAVLWFAAPRLGPFSIMLPGMITCMTASMFWHLLRPMGHTLASASVAGVAFGLFMQFVFHLYDLRLRGEREPGQ